MHMDSSKRAVLYTAYLCCRDNRSFGFVHRVQQKCEEFLFGFSPHPRTITLWCSRYDENGGAIVPFRNNPTRSGVPIKLTAAGVKDVQQFCLGKNYRGVSKSKKFPGKHGVNVTISDKTVSVWSRVAGQELSSPKKIGLRGFTPSSSCSNFCL